MSDGWSSADRSFLPGIPFKTTLRCHERASYFLSDMDDVCLPALAVWLDRIVLAGLMLPLMSTSLSSRVFKQLDVHSGG